MYKIGDLLVYKREVCEIIDIKYKYIKDIDYYCMRNVRDKTLIINVPVSSNLIRPIISKEEALNIIDKIVDIDPVVLNDKSIDNVYKELMRSNKLEDLIKMIKFTYERCEDRLKQGKKISDRDDFYLKLCEEIFYTEMSFALDIPYDSVKDFIKSRIDNEVLQ